MAQRVPNILVCDYSRVCSCYSKFIRVRSYFLGFSSSIVRTRIARGCQAATRTTAVCGVLYAASDFFVMAVVVPLLVALDGIHHRAGDPRAQFYCHADAVRELPELQVSRVALVWQRLGFVPLHQCVRFLLPVSAVQPQIKQSVQLAVVLLL